MTRKYAHLVNYLARQSGSSHSMTFDEIDRLIKDRLPATARKRRQWWDNDRSPDSRHVQSKYGWLAAGWEVESLDLIRQTVTFHK